LVRARTPDVGGHFGGRITTERNEKEGWFAVGVEQLVLAQSLTIVPKLGVESYRA
jgi:hypothetical protein